MCVVGGRWECGIAVNGCGRGLGRCRVPSCLAGETAARATELLQSERADAAAVSQEAEENGNEMIQRQKMRSL